MSLNESKGNMYEFVTHTWNTIKGSCTHNCSYCYMKRWGKQNPVRFDEKELKTDLGNGNFIFVGSSNDMFANDIPSDWIIRTLDYCSQFDNHYLFQTKNPEKNLDFQLPLNSVVCTTIETNRIYPDVMGNSPSPQARAEAMSRIDLPKYVTIEPIMDFDLDELLSLIFNCHPIQVGCAPVLMTIFIIFIRIRLRKIRFLILDIIGIRGYIKKQKFSIAQFCF